MAAIYTLYRNWNSSDSEWYEEPLMPGTVFPDITDVGGLDWTKSGAVFDNWNTSRDGTGTAYAVGDSIPTAMGDYYAIWAEATTPDITVSYNGETIFEMSSSGTEVFETNGRIMRDDFTIDYVRPEPNLQIKSATPRTYSQTVIPDSGYDGLSSVSIAAMPSGTAGTPTATKGSVSNHSVPVTPSVTNSTGYITGGTKTGTAVTVSASELVSGTLQITSNGMKDVTNYESVNVSVSAPTPSLQSKTVSPTTSQQTITADSGYDGLSSVQVNAISPTKSAQTYTPTTSNQTIASGQWLTGAQTILGDANLLPENIAEDVTIFGVTGTHSGGGGATVNLVVNEEMGTIDQKALPPGTTWTHRTDTPWISDVVIPANSIFVAESAFGSPTVSNVTLTEWRVGTRPPVFIQTFTVGTQDGTITYSI